MAPGSVAIVGSGSIGLYYGGLLATRGNAVHFLLRSGYEEARREGLRIFSGKKLIHLRHPSIYESVKAIGPVDLVIVAVKTTANASLEELIPPLLHNTTALLTLQNGLGNEEFLAQRFGAHRVMGGLCFVCLTRRSPACVDHIGHGTLSLGEFQRPPSLRSRRLTEAFRACGIKTKLVENLGEERWRKQVWNIPFNGLAVAGGGKTTDQILEDPRLQARCRDLMAEVIGLARALGHAIAVEYAEFQIARTRSMGAYRPSTLVDWQAGREMEIEPIWGEPLRQARALGIEMPQLSRLHRELLRAAKPSGSGGSRAV